MTDRSKTKQQLLEELEQERERSDALFRVRRRDAAGEEPVDPSQRPRRRAVLRALGRVGPIGGPPIEAGGLGNGEQRLMGLGPEQPIRVLGQQRR